MNLRFSNPQSEIRNRKSLRAFTMVEIALSLAIIGFALVAIIGVLPAGMSVQKDNREQTVINLDAAYLMDAIRSGPLGQDNLTNYVISITNIISEYQGNLPLGPGLAGLGAPTVHTYIFNANQTVVDGNAGAPSLTNGFNIVGLLSMPKYTFTNIPTPGRPFIVLCSNSVTAVFRAINGPAVDQGNSQASRDFAFQYQVTIEIVPSAESAFMSSGANGDWVNVTAPSFINITNSSPGNDTLSHNLQNNLYDIRLTFRWPVLGNGQLGGGKQVFRSSVAGSYLPPSSPLLPPPIQFGVPVPLPMRQSYVLANRANLFFMQAASYTP
jgi:type II secretory pathway pseudopilin PulG